MLSVGLFFACMVAGLVNSVAGGGIMVIFPALLAIGLPPITANASSNLISWPGALSSAYGYRKQLRKLPAKYLLLLLPCALGAITGAILLERGGSDQFTRMVPWLVFGAVLLFMAQPFLHQRFVQNLRTHRNAPLVVTGAALLTMSIYGGYFGAGFGFIMLAFLGFTRITSMHQVIGIKNVVSATITITCTVYFGLTGLINWHYAPVMIAGSLLGGFVGSHYAQKLNPAFIHVFIIVLGLVVSTLLFLKS